VRRSSGGHRGDLDRDTTFTFLEGSGFVYSEGRPAYYILCYGTLAYVISNFMLPPIWRYAKEHRVV
jgi:solute:Na+ symporter, SSS family